MDFQQARAIEAHVDRMMDHADGQVRTLLIELRAELRAGNWPKVTTLYDRVRELYTPPLPVEKEMCDLGIAASRAEARRLIRSNAVFVDGRRPKLGENIAGYAELKVAGKAYTPDESPGG